MGDDMIMASVYKIITGSPNPSYVLQ